ncbi:unnamed protein product [Gongylonema pulchrum]|uniref:DUF4806 domain-containing protein n=1 Tax=Gongylonema pulchrum TaxID=637853 RepID=A0A183EB45_9BILA|nr:unnamed protein product [Gongylonema pulchrum]
MVLYTTTRHESNDPEEVEMRDLQTLPHKLATIPEKSRMTELSTLLNTAHIRPLSEWQQTTVFKRIVTEFKLLMKEAIKFEWLMKKSSGFSDPKISRKSKSQASTFPTFPFDAAEHAQSSLEDARPRRFTEPTPELMLPVVFLPAIAADPVESAKPSLEDSKTHVDELIRILKELGIGDDPTFRDEEHTRPLPENSRRSYFERFTAESELLEKEITEFKLLLEKSKLSGHLGRCWTMLSGLLKNAFSGQWLVNYIFCGRQELSQLDPDFSISQESTPQMVTVPKFAVGAAEQGSSLEEHVIQKGAFGLETIPLLQEAEQRRSSFNGTAQFRNNFAALC